MCVFLSVFIDILCIVLFISGLGAGLGFWEISPNPFIHATPLVAINSNGINMFFNVFFFLLPSVQLVVLIGSKATFCAWFTFV